MSAAITPIAQALFEAVYPLVQAAESTRHREHLLCQLGWDEDAAAELFILGPQFVDWGKRGLVLVAELDKAVASKNAELQFVNAMLLLEIVFELSDAIAAQKGKPSDGPLQPGVRTALWNDLALVLPEYLLLQWLRTAKPLLYWVLRITDVVELVNVDGSQPARVPAEVPRLRMERLGALIGEPEAYLKGRYDWGYDAAALAYEHRHARSAKAPLRHGRLLEVLQRLSSDLGLTPRLGPVQQRYVGDAGKNLPGSVRLFDAGAQALAGTRQLSLPLAQGRIGSGPWAELGVELVPMPGTRGQGVIDGLFITNLARAGKAGSQALAPGWTLTASGAVDASGALGLKLLPGSVSLAQALPSSKFELRAVGQPATPWVLMGSNTGTRLELRGVEAGVAVEQQGQQAELRLFYEPKAKGGGPGLVLLLSPGESDGFIKQLLGDKELEIVFDFGFVWSSLHGLLLSGEAGLCIRLPVDLKLGPATLNEIHLCLTAGPDGLTLMGAVTAQAQLGPVVCSVKDIGMEFRLGFGAGAAKGKSFGALSVEAGFKPPEGIGLGLDCPAVRAGGYLEFDRERGEYGGTASVGIGPLSLSAVGLLDAKLPEPPGWSLLLSICAQFTPMPLGFGFTLNGVGGLIGIGRTLDLKALQHQLAAGALDAVMFPDDPVGNGPVIVNTLRSLFPVAQGQTVVGPMMKIGWGAPTLIDADLGVLIELPDPIRITLLGQIASELPVKELSLISLHLDSMGSFNLSEMTLAVDAALYDSRMVGYTLAGSMALRASFGAQPSFLMSLGGFHPRFTAPKGFPPMKRLSIGLSFDKDLRIEAQSYLALTSNTIQFGAQVVLVASLKVLTLDGAAGFDVLLNFSPFSFVADFHAHVMVLLGRKELLGVSVDARLSGPQPWYFSGEAVFRVLYKDWKYDVDFKLGGASKPLKLDKVDVAALVRAALCEPGAWTQLPTASMGVRLAASAQPAATAVAGRLPTLLLQPDQALELRQRVAPLGMALEKCGNHELTGPATVSVDRVVFGTQVLAAGPDLSDWFAPAEYFELSKDEKLEAPAFELMPAGKRLQVGGWQVGSMAVRGLEHEFGVIDRDLDHRLKRASVPLKGKGRLPADTRALRAALRKQAAAQSRQRSRVAALTLHTQEPGWRVLDSATGWSSAHVPSFAAARQVLKRRMAEQALPAGRLRVVPAVVGAAAAPATAAAPVAIPAIRPAPAPASVPAKKVAAKKVAAKSVATTGVAIRSAAEQTAPETAAPRPAPRKTARGGKEPK